MALKRVRVLTASRQYPAGVVVEMDETDANALIGRGDAEVTKDSVTRKAPKAETADADPTK